MNKKNLSLLFTATLIFLWAPLAAQQYQNGLIDKVIALVGNEMIQLSSLEYKVQMSIMSGVISDKNIRCKLLEEMLVQKLLLTQARLDSIPIRYDVVENEVENQIQDFKMRVGGEAALEEAFHKPLFKIKQDIRENLQEEVLTMDMQGELRKNLPALTPKEVETFYNKTAKDSLPIISTQYQLRQIVLYPPKEDAILAEKELLLSLRERVMNGERFASLATVYSDDDASGIRGGELGLAAKQLYHPPFADAAMVLRPGQVSQIVETPDGFHIIQLISKEGDMFNARHILRKPRFNADVRAAGFKTLDSIRTAILKDSVTFEQAAHFYSKDLKSSANGGLVSDVNSGSTLFEKDQLNPMDYTAIQGLNPGEISSPIQSTDHGTGGSFNANRPNDGRSGNVLYKIIKLEKIIPSHPANITEDYQTILDYANNKRLNDVIEAFITEKQKTTYIVIDELFSGCNFTRPGWIKK
jgi:Parvulin-like peptidyl-prolyl isomerase